MRSRQSLGTIVVSTLVLLAILAPHVAWADYPYIALSPPLSPLEQAARLSGVASQTIGRKLFPPAAQLIAPQHYVQHDYRSAWTSASPYQRTRLAERIGNQGRARYGAQQGWRQLLGARGRGIAQGPDSVYWDPYSGRLRALEAKGGSSQVKWTYGSLQGTNTNIIRSAERVLKSVNTKPVEKLAAARIIKAAQRHRLKTGVVKTPHVQGKPKAPQTTAKWDDTNVSREASRIERELVRRNPELASTFRQAKTDQARDVLKYRARKGVGVLGLVSALRLSWDAYQQSQVAFAMFRDPALRGTALPYVQSAMAFGMWAESATLGLGSAAQLGLLGQSGLKLFGQAAGKWFLPIAVGVEALNLTVTSYEYDMGRISQRDFYRRSTRAAIFAGFTTGGAIIGGILGTSAGGAGAVPGAVTGAGIGAVVAIPAQYVADWTWNRYYRDFDAQQHQAVDVAVEKLYGLQDHMMFKGG
jgi:hypothetical protein